MKKISKRLLSILMAVMMLSLSVVGVYADAIFDDADDDYKPYISLGANLTDSQKTTVLELLGVDENSLDHYDVVETTNDEEYKYLGDYLSESVIGSRALSSVLVVKQKGGHGINVETHNITYCTSGMYENALVTAGLTDAEVVVAGPMKLSGTAALVGAMKAYATMTGEEIDEESMDAATNELVISGELAEDIDDPGKIEKLIAMIKQKVVEGKLQTDEDIRNAIIESAEILEIELSEENIDKLVDLMKKIASLDLDWDTIKSQINDIYNQIANLDIDLNDSGLWSGISKFFEGIWNAISEFFSGLFSGNK